MAIETPYGVRVWNKQERGIPSDAVYVGRPSKWGNPFKIGDRYGGVTLDRTLAIGQFVDWFLYSDQGLALHCQLGELKGKDLVCWCAPQDCHAMQLVLFANRGFGIEREVEATAVAFVTKLASNVCPVCDSKVDRQKQVGQCVYAEPCGHRLYQGRVGL